MTQHNGLENKVLQMGLSDNPVICVVKAMTRRVCHLRSHHAPVLAPLLQVCTGGGQHTLSVTHVLITKTLKEAVGFLGSKIGFMPNIVSAHSLQAAGAMALLVGKMDPNIIQILG